MKIFEVQDPFGNPIELSSERWNHILKHEISNKEDVKKCLMDPDEVKKSNRDVGSQLYYKKINGEYICVVVQIEEGFIKTAYQTSTKKEGDTIWTRNN